MIKAISVITLLTVLTCSVLFDMQKVVYDDYPEDYGCVHDNHNQYDDGDSINLEFLNENYSKIH